MRLITARLATGVMMLGLGAGTALANCTPPYQTLFYCDIRDSDARVEFCMEQPDGDGVSRTHSYNFARGVQPSELYFESDDNRLDLRFYETSRDDAQNTMGVSLHRGDHFYSFYVTGLYGATIRAAQIHVSDAAAYESGKLESEKLRLYCDPDSVLIDWDAMYP